MGGATLWGCCAEWDKDDGQDGTTAADLFCFVIRQILYLHINNVSAQALSWPFFEQEGNP